jgi:hypothetical protein
VLIGAPKKYRMINVRSQTWDKINNERIKEGKTWLDFIDNMIDDYIFFKEEWEKLLKEHYVISLSKRYRNKNPKLKVVSWQK